MSQGNDQSGAVPLRDLLEDTLHMPPSADDMGDAESAKPPTLDRSLSAEMVASPSDDAGLNDEPLGGTVDTWLDILAPGGPESPSEAPFPMEAMDLEAGPTFTVADDSSEAHVDLDIAEDANIDLQRLRMDVDDDDHG